MEYQKITNLIENKNAQPKLRIRNWVEINDWSNETCSTINIKFKTTVFKVNNKFKDAYILAKGTITVANAEIADANPNNVNKKVIFNNFAPFK